MNIHNFQPAPIRENIIWIDQRTIRVWGDIMHRQGQAQPSGQPGNPQQGGQGYPQGGQGYPQGGQQVHPQQGYQPSQSQQPPWLR